jgi:hypothetical protein
MDSETKSRLRQEFETGFQNYARMVIEASDWPTTQLLMCFGTYPYLNALARLKIENSDWTEEKLRTELNLQQALLSLTPDCVKIIGMFK